tara:strand:- start:668 stop:994 length:327 start_codon:yes stop_codon:yes gene_type:complete
MYFDGTHSVTEPTSTQEMNQITNKTSSTLKEYGLDVRSISMAATNVSTGELDTIKWRVDLVYAGSAIPITSVLVAAMNHNIASLGEDHANSLWSQHEDLVSVSHTSEV